MRGPVPVSPILESERLLLDELSIVQAFPNDHVGEPEGQGPIGPWIDGNPLISLGGCHREAWLHLDDFRLRPWPLLSQIPIHPMRQNRRPACLQQTVPE